MNICERIRPCNENSECIYSRENNTFYCRCLNGAAGCDSVYLSAAAAGTNNDDRNVAVAQGTPAAAAAADAVSAQPSSAAAATPTVANSAQPLESTIVMPKILAGGSGGAQGEVANNAQSGSRPKPEIPKFGFNYDNVRDLKFMFSQSNLILNALMFVLKLYLILPVALVILVVLFFSSIVIYFGLKAR